MKVWILEKFISAKQTQKTIDELIEIREKLTDSTHINICDKLIKGHEKDLIENPKGYWLGITGKISYNYFCYDAIDTIYRKPNEKYRVIQADISNDSETWINYTNIVEKPQVIKYLRYKAKHYFD